jgi:hypothetical protein
MHKAWDSDRKLLTILLVLAAISLAASYRDVLADSAGQLVKKVEGALGELRSKLPKESPKPRATVRQQESFDPRGGQPCERGCAENGGSAWYGIVDCEGHVRVVRRCHAGDGCSR